MYPTSVFNLPKGYDDNLCRGEMHKWWTGQSKASYEAWIFKHRSYVSKVSFAERLLCRDFGIFIQRTRWQDKESFHIWLNLSFSNVLLKGNFIFCKCKLKMLLFRWTTGMSWTVNLFVIYFLLTCFYSHKWKNSWEVWFCNKKKQFEATNI